MGKKLAVQGSLKMVITIVDGLVYNVTVYIL